MATAGQRAVWPTCRHYSEPNLPPQAEAPHWTICSLHRARLQWQGRKHPLIATRPGAGERWTAWCFVNRDGTLGDPLTLTRANSPDKGSGYDECRYEGRTSSRTLNYPTSEELRDWYKLSTVQVDYD